MKRLLITTFTLLFAVGAVAAPAAWAQTPTAPPAKTDTTMPGEKKPEKKAQKKAERKGEKMAKKSEKKSAAKDAKKEAEKKAEEKK
jgi:Ni/Co efflux regulator RcnB